jgi:predicted AlkP superfamily phosphohydrolase/phosphomutase
MLQSVTGIARFYVRQLEPHLEFYVSAVNFDPAAPMFPVSAPPDYARELADKIGLFSTLGMAEDHNGLNNGRLDEAAYLQHCELVLAERERTMRFELDRFSEGLFFMLFDTPDRVQHMLWRFRDREHPGFEPDLSPELATRIEEHYRRCDGLLTPVLDKLDERNTADRAFRSRLRNFPACFRHQYLVVSERLLALKGSGKPGGDMGEGFAAVDWSKTYAYAVGLGGIYLNFKGREGGGILEEGKRSRTGAQCDTDRPG